MENIDKKLQEIIGKENVLKNEPMNKHTSLKIGGPAEYFLKINSIQNLKKVLELANEENMPIIVIGNGTNLLIREGGIKGFVIKLVLNEFKIKKVADEILLTVEAGMNLASISTIAAKEEIEGLEFLAGIPGTIGGAIRMNAGAYGKEIKDLVVKTRYMTYDGKIKTLLNEEHEFEYRNSIFSKLNAIILDTTLKASKGNEEEIISKINDLAKSRREAQPLEYPTAGSTFKRKDGIVVAKLIDECGLKGLNVGDAEVSTKHAGFIINKGKATSTDVLNLVNIIKEKIKEKYDIDLDLEILVLGEEK